MFTRALLNRIKDKFERTNDGREESESLAVTVAGSRTFNKNAR